jgi:hypothetical protein
MSTNPQTKSDERLAKEDELYNLLRAESEWEYGAPGSYALEQFLSDLSDQIDAMSAEELEEQLKERR